jgi:hypothetical protein
MTNSFRRMLILALGVGLAGCGDSGSGPGDDPDPDPDPDPGPGPHYSVVPIELEKLARVTPVGTNGKVLPIGHTYWYTCDTEWLMPTDRPCVRERLPIRSPVDGTVFQVEHVPDGGITIQGPPGLYAGFAHVTPVAELQRGDAVQAGDTIAVMYSDFAFDFGMTNYGIDEHRFVNQERFRNNPAYLHTQSPIAQYPEPIRTELLARVRTQSDPLGRIVFDVAGTAAGGWFIEGTPYDDSLTPAYETASVFLGPLQERDDVRLVSKVGWFLAVMDIAVADPEAPRWEDIGPATGPVWVTLWSATREGGPDFTRPAGGVRLEVLDGEKLRIEWFDTHDDPGAFTAAAGLYER